MVDAIDSRIARLGITLPPQPVPSANYMPFVRHESLVQLAGVAPTENGEYAVVGKIGQSLDFADGVRAARLCALNAISNLKFACEGDLDRVQKIMMVRGFVNASEEFMRIPQVMNGASDLLISVFGEEIGTHARTSIGCSTMPSRVAVEIDCLVVINAEGLT